MNLLVGFNGSNMTVDVLPVVRHRVDVLGAKVYVVTSMRKANNNQYDKMQQVERRLASVKTFFQANNIPCETHLLVRGLSAGEDLVKFAKEKQIDEILVCIRKRSKVEKLLMGSTAQYVILNAPCPVVAVK